MPKALQIKVNENHVFGIFFNSSTSGLYIEKGDSGYKNGMSLSRTCAKSTNNEILLFTFDTVNLQLKTTNLYRSPSIQPFIEETGRQGELSLIP